ncbi:MAG: diphosphomevalonate decarboxylase [Candidatus Micrarchaeia archaeon]
MEFIATAEATPNIAIIKFWGARDEKLILPMQGSISVTLDEKLKTRTSVLFSRRFKKDTLIINGVEQKGKEVEERLRLLDVLRKKANTDLKAKIVSVNTFPTKAGLASSASGIAALVVAAASALKLKLNEKELSTIARLGSGSASRSIIGGFVEWKRGKKEDGSDSYAKQIVDSSYWPEFRDVIAVVETKEKKISSRAGMRRTVATSILYPARIKYLPKIIKETKKAILSKDHQKLFEIAMRESNNMHATILDTWPPIFYLNNTSIDIINKIHELNESSGEIIAAYSFDAGPNANIFTLKKYVNRVKKALKEVKGIKYFIECEVGKGPKLILDKKEYLIDENGKPKKYYINDKNQIIVRE